MNQLETVPLTHSFETDISSFTRLSVRCRAFAVALNLSPEMYILIFPFETPARIISETINSLPLLQMFFGGRPHSNDFLLLGNRNAGSVGYHRCRSSCASPVSFHHHLLHYLTERGTRQVLSVPGMFTSANTQTQI